MSMKKPPPKYKPLETLSFSIKGDCIPALSSYFVTQCDMVAFILPPKRPSANSQSWHTAKDSWLYFMDIYRSNMDWLLSLSHHKFWSQVVYGEETWAAVISFLQEAYPYYAMDTIHENDKKVKELYYKIYYLVFQILRRVTVRKESEECWIGEKKYGSLLYNYTIISVPMLIDISAIYGYYDKDETQRIINSVFSAQTLYKEDLETSIPYIKEALALVETKSSSGSLQLEDSVSYVLDVAGSLYSFLDLYSDGVELFRRHKFEVNLASFYESAIPSICENIRSTYYDDDKMAIFFNLNLRLSHARFFCINIFRLCMSSALASCFENSCAADNGPSSPRNSADKFLEVFTECLTFKNFINDYHSKHPIDEDLEFLSQNCPDMDNFKCHYLLESVLSCLQGGKRSNSQHYQSSKNQNTLNNASTPSPSRNNDAYSVPSSSSAGFLDDDNVKLISLISEVKDILPHCDDGFIKKCLEYYNYSSSDVINAVLENVLPDELASLDFSMPLIPPEVEGNTFVHNRVNIFDNDEFDVMRRDHVDTSRIYKGKRQDSEDLNQILNDKTFREELRSKYNELSIIESFDNVYDDEYDDTYDDTEVPVPEVEEHDRKFVVPRVFQQQRRQKDDDPEESDEEEATQAGNRRFDQFVENPEVARARYAKSRESKYGTQPRRDVVGNARGQGQENDTLRNRNLKNVHKSSNANHNRKKGAQYKRSQGLLH